MTPTHPDPDPLSGWSSSLRPPLDLQPPVLPKDAGDDDDRAAAELLEAALEGDVPRMHRLAKKLYDAGKGIDKAVAAAAFGVPGSKRRGALHLAAANGKAEMCNSLIKAGCAVDATDSDGATPLILAIQGLGSTGVIKLLLSGGADVNKADNNGVVPLHIASERGLYEIAALLLSNGADVDLICENGGAPVHVASKNGHAEVLKLLLQHNADYDKLIGSLNTPLSVSLIGPSVGCMNILVEAGADVNAGNPAPLVIAAGKGLTGCIKCLLKAGADANIPDEHGVLPVQIAARQGWNECVEILFPLTSLVAEYETWSIDGLIQHEKNENSRESKKPMRCLKEPSNKVSRVHARPSHSLSDDDELLANIFLRLEDVADLVRTSATCTTFCRVIFGRPFLRRFQSLHRPPILGLFEFCGIGGIGLFHPADPPHRSSQIMRALQTADFAFSCLPACRVFVCDSRDCRVLLAQCTSLSSGPVELIVCDPLHRKYFHLPPVPSHLLASMGSLAMSDLDPFFGPTSGEDLHFRVFFAGLCADSLMILEFCSMRCRWRHFSVRQSPALARPWFSLTALFVRRYYAHGCCYWMSDSTDSIVMLDMDEMKLSVMDIPVQKLSVMDIPVQHGFKVGMVEAGDNKVGLLILECNHLRLYHKTLDDGWLFEKEVILPALACNWNIMATARSFALLQACSPNLHAQESQCFIVDLITSEVERFCVLRGGDAKVRRGQLFAGYPQSVSYPTI